MKVSLLNVPVSAVSLLLLCILASVQAAPTYDRSHQSVNCCGSSQDSTMDAAWRSFSAMQQQMSDLFASMSQNSLGLSMSSMPADMGYRMSQQQWGSRRMEESSRSSSSSRNWISSETRSSRTGTGGLAASASSSSSSTGQSPCAAASSTGINSFNFGCQ